MKLFLSSQAISKEQAPHLIGLVGKPAKDIRMAVIENAADVEAGPKPWLLRNRQMIESHGFDVEYIDLKHYAKDTESLWQKLTDKDVLWFGGGNTFYLRWLIHSMGIENILKDLVESGKVYGGGSAGSIIAGPTLQHFETADDVHEAPEVILDGLNLTDKVVLPHMDSAKYAPIMDAINDKLQADGYRTVPLTDAQALVNDGDEEKII
ncbi:MAG TPA: Type 1 glutamine amidotransferase-like domain-containing protein [Candidatus Saccharimonadales bacterium]